MANAKYEAKQALRALKCIGSRLRDAYYIAHRHEPELQQWYADGFNMLAHHAESNFGALDNH
jgi:hypothetical protein